MPHNDFPAPSLSGPFAAAGLAERGRRRANRYTNEADKRWLESIRSGQGMNTVLTNRPSLGSTLEFQGNAQWGPMFEALQEIGERTGKDVELGLPGLREEEFRSESAGTLPLSLQGLQGAQYTYTAGGRPIAVTYKRDKGR
jgi:hypothetical protein